MSSEISRPRRYAIYFVPAADTPLYRFGAALLGYDAYQGASLTPPEMVTRAVADWGAVSEEPRKYGFHATLKAPIALADRASEVGLIAACEEFSATPRVVPTFSPVVRAIGDFIALVPERQPPALSDLAQDCVVAFDRFRAPLTETDRARRNPAALSPRQRCHLDRWGYPYVGEDFRFHMTLTGRLAAERRGRVLDLLGDAFAQTGITAIGVDRIALCRQADPAARFRVLRSFPLI
jgi:putative phosphonate metabolism protein